VSVNVDRHVVPPGGDDHVEWAWELKERIRREDGVLKQRQHFFREAYQRATVHLLVVGEDIAGFAAVRDDGYILFLAVAPEYRGEGYGRRLVAAVAENHNTVTCHARTTNQDAIAFYKQLGFSIRRRIDRYYEDNGDAYYLELREDESLRSRLSDLVSR
jgi:ribosomal protein S18 acetylase RimI-like enzyme